MSFSNPNLWALRYLQSFSSANIGLFYPAIPPFDTPILTDATLRVLLTSSTANANWTYAGRVGQFVNAGGVNSVTETLSLRLNEPKIWQLPAEFSQYSLRFFLPRYFKQATVSIFGYTSV
jgi:hypothetical protein